jgi:hypothetical protein
MLHPDRVFALCNDDTRIMEKSHPIEGEHERPRSVTSDQRQIFHVALLMDSNDSFESKRED